MSLFNRILGRKDDPKINSYEDFWKWFQANQDTFYKVVKTGKNIDKDFFKKLSPKLDELKAGYFFLTGMYNDDTAELVLTPDGNIKNIVFVEELVHAAPSIRNWKFTALKPPIDITSLQIKMGEYSFDSENLSFYDNENNKYPDEVDIVVVHHDFNEEDKATITNGVYIFIDNYLGELNAVSTIDNIQVVSKEDAEKELIPITKLKDYLIWREKEFTEKYSGHRYDTENDTYSALEAEVNGQPLVAIINTALLEWDGKASHPWILTVEIKYDGSDSNGMPGPDIYEVLEAFEDKIMLQLKDYEGYLNIGRQTAANERNIFFACQDFRKPSKVLYELIKESAGNIDVSYSIYKDKYWQSLEFFAAN